MSGTGKRRRGRERLVLGQLETLAAFYIVWRDQRARHAVTAPESTAEAIMAWPRFASIMEILLAARHKRSNSTVGCMPRSWRRAEAKA